MDTDTRDKSLTLKDAYRAFFETGCVLPSGANDPEQFAELSQHVSSVAAPFPLNPYLLQYNEKRSPYAGADHFTQQAQNAGLKVCGSTLVWNGLLPTTPPGTDSESYVRHVGDACLHFSGRVQCWTVVSEALSGMDSSFWRADLKDCLWKQVFGGGTEGGYYIDVAFRTARGTAPDARLYYGESVFDGDGRQGSLNVPKLQNLIALVSDINRTYRAEGYGRNLIEGISLKGLFTTETALGEVETVLRQLAPLGLDIEIAPFRVDAVSETRDPFVLSDSERVDEKYVELLCLFRSWSEQISRVVFAELPPYGSQRYTAFLDPERFSGRPFLSAPPLPRPKAKAYYGTPLIDGHKEELWQETEPIPVCRYHQGWESAHGTARVLWDEENIYVLVEIDDETQDCSGPLSFEHDSVEIYLSESGHYENDFTAGDSLYRVDCENNRSVGLNVRSLSFESAVHATPHGYTAELRIPLRTRRLSAGLQLGFDVQINDAEGSTRVGIATWHEGDGESWNNPTVWGRLSLCRQEERPEELLERRTPEAHGFVAESPDRHMPESPENDDSQPPAAYTETVACEPSPAMVPESTSTPEEQPVPEEAAEQPQEAIPLNDDVSDQNEELPGAQTKEVQDEADAEGNISFDIDNDEDADISFDIFDEAILDVSLDDEADAFAGSLDTEPSGATEDIEGKTVSSEATQDGDANIPSATEPAAEDDGTFETVSGNTSSGETGKTAMSLSELFRLALGNTAAPSVACDFESEGVSAAISMEEEAPITGEALIGELQPEPEIPAGEPEPYTQPEISTEERSSPEPEHTLPAEKASPEAEMSFGEETPSGQEAGAAEAKETLPAPMAEETDDGNTKRRHTAELALTALSDLDSAEAALESLSRIDAMLELSEQVLVRKPEAEQAEAVTVPHPVPRQTDDLPLRRFRLRLLLGFAALGAAGLTLWRITHIRRREG